VEALRVVGVLPRLVVEPSLGAAPVLDEAVPVAIAVLVDPAERGEGRLVQLVHEFGVVSPTPGLGQEDQEERRRVSGSVVAVEPLRRTLPAAYLMHDLPRLRVARRILSGRLKRRELPHC